MLDKYLWMAVQCDSEDMESISGIHWRCEKFDIDGKVGEQTGSFALQESIHFEKFSGYSPEDINEIIFSNVDKNSIEQSVLPQESGA